MPNEIVAHHRYIFVDIQQPTTMSYANGSSRVNERKRTVHITQI